MAVEPGADGLAADVASALAGEAIAPLPGEPFEVVVPPDSHTIAERFSRYGMETAAFLSADPLREELGFFQGILHGSDLPLLMAEADQGPLRGAVDGAYTFLEDKLPRPMEDAAFLWLHLDLELIPDPQARGPFFEKTIEHFEDLLARRPDSTLVWSSFGQGESAGAVGVRSPWSAGPQAPIQAQGIFQVLVEAAGHEATENATVRLGEVLEILTPEAEAEDA